MLPEIDACCRKVVLGLINILFVYSMAPRLAMQHPLVWGTASMDSYYKHIDSIYFLALDPLSGSTLWILSLSLSQTLLTTTSHIIYSLPILFLHILSSL